MRVAVIGTGYVGMVQAVCLCDLGHDVLLVENQPEHPLRLKKNDVAPQEEPEISQRFLSHYGSRLLISGDIASASSCEVVFICLDTSRKSDGSPNLSPTEAAVSQLSAVLKYQERERSLIIVMKSTVPVGTCRCLYRKVIASGVSPSKFTIVSNPEFLREGFGVSNFNKPDRIVLGVRADDDAAAQRMIQLYGEVARRTECMVMSLESAELVKLASNAFLASKVSFANMIADLCESIGADAADVLPAMGKDGRIGAGNLRPGIGWGGGCLPKDINYLISDLKSNNISAAMLESAWQINAARPRWFVDRLKKMMGNLRGKRIAAWGLGYRGGSHDLRSSPALSVVNWLLSEGAVVTTYDQGILKLDRAANLRVANDPIDAVSDAEALCILTEDAMFRELITSGKCRQAMRVPIVFDGRNLFDRDEIERITAAGYTYISIGRNTIDEILKSFAASAAS